MMGCDEVGRRFSLLTLTRSGGCREWRRVTAQWHLQREWSYYELEGASDVTQGRSEVASYWLANHTTDWAVWLDDDHPIVWETLHAFCETALQNEDRLDLLCASYVPKVPLSNSLTVLPQPSKITLGQGGALVPIVACGFGLVAVKRRLFEKVARNLPLVRYMLSNTLGRPYFMSRVEPSPADPAGAGRHQGEDFAFCYRAREAGGRLYCDTRVRLGHHGAYTYHWEDMQLAVERVSTVYVTREHPLAALQRKEQATKEGTHGKSENTAPPPNPTQPGAAGNRAERRAAARAAKKRR